MTLVVIGLNLRYYVHPAPVYQRGRDVEDNIMREGVVGCGARANATTVFALRLEI